MLSLLGLVPREPAVLFGAEALGIGATVWLIGVIGRLRWRRVGVPRLRFWSSLLLEQLQSLPFAASGVLLMSGDTDGVNWIAPGVIFSVISGLANTWVLLVEILR